MSAQRARSTVAAEDRSAHPGIPGVPWWGAILIAVGATFAGFAIDAGSGNKELTFVFAALYFLGCVAAVLAVRQSGVFTAVVQPPLILFVAVPAAYFLFHRSEISGVKDVLINCGYPLIERFLLMFTTSVVVLLIGMARWYYGASHRTARPAARNAAVGVGLVAGVGAKVTAMLNRSSDATTAAGPDPGPEPAPPRPRKHTIDRTAAPREPRAPRQRDPATRTRQNRPRPDDAPPPRRRYARDAEDAPPPRRRAPRESGTRRTPPRDNRNWEPPAWEPPEAPRRSSRYQGAYDPYDPYAAPPPRPGARHPFSNVRYRGDDDGDDATSWRPPGR